MSAGGVFKLIANDGKADRMILASELLNSRIKEIMCQRADRGFSDPTPTLVDIERTHILFVNAHFKPFAAVGCEYNKVRTSSGTPQFGSTVQFSIPQFGDFFNDMVVNVTMSSAGIVTGTVPIGTVLLGLADTTAVFTGAGATALAAGGTRVTGTTATAAGAVVHTLAYTDQYGTELTLGATSANKVVYADYPGQRLFKRVKFEVNGNPLDEYTAEAYAFHQKFKVCPHKRTGWNRLVGQQVLKRGTRVVDSANHVLDTAATITGTRPFTLSTDFYDGPQTPKTSQPILDLWVPLLFWFNTDTRLSIPSVSIPFGQRYITIELETQDKVVFASPGIYLSYHKGVAALGATLSITPASVTSSTVNTTTHTITTMELYINNIFVNPEIHDIYIKRIGFSLIRVHLFQSERLSSAEGNIHLNKLKWPIETIFLGFRPVANSTGTNWHMMSALTPVVPIQEVAVAVTATAPASGVRLQSAMGEYTVEEYLPTVTQLKLEAHGISIFQQTKAPFFSDYLPYTYGGQNIVTPEDPGAYMINFCLHPGSYQPSGHINVSRAREFYLSYTSTYIGTNTPVDLLVLGIALNFVLISDGGLMLRYTT